MRYATGSRFPLTRFRLPVASLGWVTPGAATKCVTPLFFPEKPGDLFLLASTAMSPLISSSQNLTTFFRSSLYRFLLLSLGCRHPPRGCHPTPFLPVRPRFSAILCKFAHIFSFGCHPPGGCHPGRSAPSLLVTPLNPRQKITSYTQRQRRRPRLSGPKLIIEFRNILRWRLKY